MKGTNHFIILIKITQYYDYRYLKLIPTYYILVYVSPEKWGSNAKNGSLTVHGLGEKKMLYSSLVNFSIITN